MSIVPKGCIEVKYQGVVKLRGETSMIPFIMLKDGKERTVAVPLDTLEETLIKHALNENNEGPQPYRTLVSCIEGLSASVDAVHILYSAEFDLPTRLILNIKSRDKVEVDVPCVEGIACALLSEAPIYISEELIAAIGTSTPDTEGRIF